MTKITFSTSMYRERQTFSPVYIYETKGDTKLTYSDDDARS